MSAKPVLLLVGDEQEYRSLCSALSDAFCVCLCSDASAYCQPFDAALIDASTASATLTTLRERSPSALLLLCGDETTASDTDACWIHKPIDCSALKRRLLRTLSPTLQNDALDTMELFDSLPGGICLFDLTEGYPQVVYYNDAVRLLSGYPRDEYDRILRRNYQQLILPADRPVLLHIISEFRSEPRLLSASFRLRRKDGSVCWLKVTCAPMRDKQNRVLCNAIFIDVSHDKENERRTEQMLEEMKYRSERDALTGVYNRETFYTRARELLDSNPNETYIILAMDIERFKVVNDLFGKDMGDRVLQAIGAGLEKLMRGMGVCGRLEADHFAACFPERHLHPEQMHEIYNTLLLEQDIAYHIDMSFGVYRIHNPNVTINKMCDRATMALKTAKGSIVKRYAYYDEVLRRTMLEEQSILDEMNDALAEGQFVPYIQPIYSVETRQPVSAEALVRWKHPRKGLISPAAFIPLFERNGFITKLDASVWEQIVRLMAQWREKGITLPVSINISRIDLYQPRMCDDLLALVRKHGVEPSQLRLEITESAYSDDPDELTRVITQLRSHGFQILMDDFGSGYSSLNVLMDMPVDILKIDMRFLAELDTNQRAASILTSVTRMAKWLSIPVVAEGVETENQLSFLRSIGCDSAQGYLFGKPMPAAEFESQLRSSALPARTSPITDGMDLSILWNSSVETNLMFNGMIGGMALYELTGDALEIRRVNDGYYELFGCTPKQVFRESPNALKRIHPEDQETLLTALRSASESGRIECIRVRHKHADGHMLWLEARVRFLGDVGQNKVFYCTFSDITAQRELEQSVEMNRYLGVLRTAYPLILELNCADQTLKPVYNDGRIQLPPPGASGLFEREDLAQMVHPDDIREFLQAFDKVYIDEATAATGTYTSEQRLLGDNGDYTWTSRTILQLQPQSALYLVCFSDIDARKRNDVLSQQNRILQLKQDELMRYQALMEQTGSSMLEWNMNNNALICSKGYDHYAISRYPIAEIWDGKHLDDAFDMKDAQTLPLFRESLLRHGKGSITIRMKRVDAEPIWCRLVCAIVKGRHASRLIAAITQVDELIRTRESYISSQVQFQSFADNFMVGLGVYEFVNDKPHMLYLSNGYQKLVGLTDAEFLRLRDHPFLHLHPDDVELVMRSIDSLRLTGEPFTLEYRAYHTDGRALYLRMQARMLIPMDHAAPRMLTVVTDVTELKTLQNHLQSLLDEVPAGVGIYELSNPPRAKYINRRMAAIFGYSYDELCAFHDRSAINLLETDPEKLEAVKREAMNGALTLDNYYRTRKKDGSPIWVRARSSVLESAPGTVACYTLLIDETREHNAELKLHWQEEGYRLLAEHTGATTFDYDVEADVISLMFHPFGSPPYQLVMRDHLARIRHSTILKRDFIESYSAELRAAIDGVCEKTFEFLADFGGNGYHWYRAYFISVADDHGAVYRVIGRLLDITNERVAEESLQQEQTYRKALLAEVLFLFDVDYQAQTASLLHLSDGGGFYPANAYYKASDEQSRYIHPEDYEAIHAFLTWEALRRLGKEGMEVKRQLRILDTSQQWVWVEAAFTPLTGTTRALLSVKVVDSARRREEELRARAEVDPVSGVLNRCTLQERIGAMLREQPDATHAFLLMDIDGFKQINDTYGHATGDTVIRVMAQAIQNVFTSILGRLGGDEFVALLTDVEDLGVVKSKAQEIIRLVDDLRFPESDIRLTLSIGIALSTAGGSTFDTLYRNADDALYLAKAQGKHAYRIHQDEMP